MPTNVEETPDHASRLATLQNNIERPGDPPPSGENNLTYR